MRHEGTKAPRHVGAMMVWVLAIALFMLHQDWWFWGDATLLLGFMPVGLAYHALFSIAAGLLWALAIKIAWPTTIEQWADDIQNHGDE